MKGARYPDSFPYLQCHGSTLLVFLFWVQDVLFESWSVVYRLGNEPCMGTVIVEYLQTVVFKFNVAPGLQIPHRG